MKDEKKKANKQKDPEKTPEKNIEPGIERIESDPLPEIEKEKPEDLERLENEFYSHPPGLEKTKLKPKLKPKKETRGRKKGSKNKPKPQPQPQPEPQVELPDIKIPLANFILKLTKGRGKWEADTEEAKLIEESFDYWCQVRANWLKRFAPEIYILIAAGNYALPRLMPKEEEKEKSQT